MPQIFWSTHFQIFISFQALLLLIIHVKHVDEYANTAIWIFFTFFFYFYVGVQPINNVLVVPLDSKWTQLHSHMCIHSSPNSSITLSRGSHDLCLFMFNQLYVSLLTHLHRTQGHGHSLKYLLNHSLVLRRNICSRKFCF